MKKINQFIIVLCLTVPYILTAQSWQWAHSGGSNAPPPDQGLGVVVGNNEHIYCLGNFGISIALDSNYYIGNQSAYFLAEYNAGGDVLKSTLSHKNNSQSGFSLQDFSRDNRGNLYLSGSMDGSNTFDTIVVFSNYFGYTAKFNPDVRCEWVKPLSDINYSTAFDSEDNIYVAGTISGNNSYIDTFSLHNPDGMFKPKMFFAKLDSTGKCLWVKQSYGGSCGGYCRVANNEIYLAGRIDSCAVFDTVTLCPPTTTGSNFIFKMDTLGRVIYSFSYSMYGSAPQSLHLSTDGNGDAYIFGTIDSMVVIDGQTVHKQPNSQNSGFFGKLNSNLNLVWLKVINSSGNIFGSGIHTDSLGNTYITGTFSGTAIFGNDTVTAQSTTDMFVARYNSSGNCYGVVTVPNAVVNAIAQDETGNAIITGYIHTGDTYFGSIKLTSNGNDDYFIAKLSAIISNIAKTDEENTRLVIYPNPNNKSFTIEVPEGLVHSNRAHLGIYDNSGKAIKDEQADIMNRKVTTDIGMVQKGIYTVILSSGKKKFTGRVVVE